MPVGEIRAHERVLELAPSNGRAWVGLGTLALLERDLEFALRGRAYGRGSLLKWAGIEQYLRQHPGRPGGQGTVGSASLSPKDPWGISRSDCARLIARA